MGLLEMLSEPGMTVALAIETLAQQVPGMPTGQAGLQTPAVPDIQALLALADTASTALARLHTAGALKNDPPCPDTMLERASEMFEDAAVSTACSSHPPAAHALGLTNGAQFASGVRDSNGDVHQPNPQVDQAHD